MVQCNSLFAENFRWNSYDYMMILLLQAPCFKFQTAQRCWTRLQVARPQEQGPSAVYAVECTLECTKMTACLCCSTRFIQLHTWRRCHKGCTFTAMGSAASAWSAELESSHARHCRTIWHDCRNQSAIFGLQEACQWEAQCTSPLGCPFLNTLGLS